MDPWLVGCVQKEVNPDLPVLTVSNGAHHTETFLPQADDAERGTNVVEVRKQIESYLEKWMLSFINQQRTKKGTLAQTTSQEMALKSQRFPHREHKFVKDMSNRTESPEAMMNALIEQNRAMNAKK